MKIKLRVSGSLPPPDMRPGEYVARCDHGEVSVRGNKISAVLSFSTLGRVTAEGFKRAYEGVLLRQWYELGQRDPDGQSGTIEIKPFSKYGIAWAKSMGRPLKQTDDPAPGAFQKKIFKVDVGYRSNLDGNFSYKNTGRPKDPRDFLRIHSIIEKIEEKALTHMGPYQTNGTSDTDTVTEAFNSNSNNSEFSDSSSSFIKSDFRVASMTNDRSDLGHAKSSWGEIEPLPGANDSIPPGELSSTMDGGGFDWQDGTQHEVGVEYVGGNGEIKHAMSIDRAWDEIKAEHKARRASKH